MRYFFRSVQYRSSFLTCPSSLWFCFKVSQLCLKNDLDSPRVVHDVRVNGILFGLTARKLPASLLSALVAPKPHQLASWLPSQTRSRSVWLCQPLRAKQSSLMSCILCLQRGFSWQFLCYRASSSSARGQPSPWSSVFAGFEPGNQLSLGAFSGDYRSAQSGAVLEPASPLVGPWWSLAASDYP